MKEFIQGLVTLIGAVIITAIYLPFGFPYTYLHAIYWTIKGVKKRTKGTFFQLICRQINGMLAAVGYLMFHAGVALDMVWNVNGELIEDCTTTVEDTWFGKKYTTVSTATGREEVLERQKPLGKKFNVWLNKLFGQKSHAKDSYNKHNEDIERGKKYFQ